MEKNISKIVVWTSPVAPFQKIYVFKEGVLVDQMGIMPNNIVDIIFELVDKYQINDIDFSGTYSFGKSFIDEIQKQAVTQYKELNVNFVG